MAQMTFLVSFLLGLGLLSAVVALTGRGRREYSLSPEWGRRERSSVLARAVDSPAVWTVVFVTVTLAFGGAAILFVGGADAPEWLVAAGGLFLGAAATVVAVCYVFYGTFASARSRGLKNAQAALFGSWALGTLFLAAVVVKLLGAF